MNKWIEKYLSIGWSLIPIEPKGKRPLISWTPYQTKRADLAEIQSWLKQWPQMNLGVCTGELSKIVVADFDGIEGLKSMKSSTFPRSAVTSISGNGKQAFYKWTEPIKNSVKQIANGVDIRGDRGYVVLPPSVHPNGKIYRWERFVPEILKSMPTLSANQLIQEHGISKESGWIARALEEMTIGNIDNTLTSVLGRMRRDGYTDNDARVLLKPHAERAGAEGDHLEEKIRNIWSRYEARPVASSAGAYSEQSELSIHSPADEDSFKRFNDSLGTTTRRGIETGFPTLDRYFEGGLKSERLFTVAARTGTGKTNFAIALAANLCQQGKKVLFFSTEFQYEKIWQRYIVTLPSNADFRRHPLYVCDSFSPRIEQVEEAIKRIMPDVFIFDHINHIGEERESLGAFMQGANYLQRKYNTQGVMVAQLNRQADWVENGKRIEPRMSMIKGSGTIEQASSRVLLLSEVRVTPEVNEIIGVLDKNDSGDRGLINFGLYKQPYVMRELI